MKKYLFLILTGLAFSSLEAQEIKDAVRYAQDNTNGTARFRAMSGAFGALGLARKTIEKKILLT